MARIADSKNKDNILPFIKREKRISTVKVLVWINLVLILGLYILVFTKM